MNIKLLSYTPDGEKLVASAAKLCYSSVGVEEIEKGLNEENIASFLDMLISVGHESPIEHVSFTFAAEGVSRTLTHQLVRHRIASYSQQSQRYVKLDQFEYIMPPAIEDNEEAKKIFIEAMENDQKAYDEISEKLFDRYYKENIDKGMKERRAKSAAEKSAIEDARYVFPNACETKIVFTMNARTLLNFFRLRCCNRAQWEIRELAIGMLKEVKSVYPVIFKNAGPSCLVGPCPEGNMTCGKIEEVRAYFRNEV